MAERPLVDKRLDLHMRLSVDDYSFSGFPQSGAIVTNPDSIIDVESGKSTIIPIKEEFRSAIESAGLTIDQMQNISGESITIGGEKARTNLGFIVKLKDSNALLNELREMENNLLRRFSVENEGFTWKRIESEAEGKVAGGPRPFASAEIDILFDIKQRQFDQIPLEGMGNLEKRIRENTSEGFTGFNPDVTYNNDMDMFQIKTRTKKLFRDEFEIALNEINKFSKSYGRGYDLVWITVEEL